jgi:hypothetical protein
MIEETEIVNEETRGQTRSPDAEYQHDFLNYSLGAIGRTVSTKYEPNTSSKFHFWISNNDDVRGLIEIGNIVAALSDDGMEITFGSVTEMRSYSDVESFISDYLSHNFGEAEVRVPTDISEVIVVSCVVMRNLSSTTKPVGRSAVFFPSVAGIQFSYGLIDADGQQLFAGAAIPIGVFENGDGTIAPISVDENFLVGPEGAHLNVSGISGLASKTSAIEFVVKSVLTTTAKRIGVVMFNVKSKDLLYIDQANVRLDEENELSNWSREVYETLGIPRTPFENARFFAPSNPANPTSSQSLRSLTTNVFSWDLNMIYRDMPSLFNAMDWDEKIEGAWYVVNDEIERGNILTYTQMLRWLDNLIDRANQQGRQWERSCHIATWNKLRSHLNRFPRSYRGLIATAGGAHDIPWTELDSGDVFVIDIQMLGDPGQKLVFGRAIRSLSDKLEQEELNLDAVIVFVDELNKFAPSGSTRSPLKSNLINITARGRSLGLILFGAEQFASAVDKEVVENSSTFLFGRTETNELRSPTYAALSDEVKTKLTMLPQGELLAKFPKFSQPIFLRFPLPPCLPGDQFRSDELEVN